MNIFWLDYDLEKNARYYADKHVSKMILEYTQILSTVNRMEGLNEGYKITHKNHPCVIWTKESLDNWVALKLLAKKVHKEFIFRFGGAHASMSIINSLSLPPLVKKGITNPPICVPNYCQCDDIVESYRKYYIRDKRHLAFWTRREIPFWFK